MLSVLFLSEKVTLAKLQSISIAPKRVRLGEQPDDSTLSVRIYNHKCLGFSSVERPYGLLDVHLW